jgi:hypothetical protein
MGAHNELKLEGFDELRAALRTLPEHLALQAGEIVLTHAQEAARRMDALYAQHEWTGNLRRSLSVTSENNYLRFGARAVVKNRAPHAWWAEHGTQLRKDKKGVKRGAMPPLKIFIPIAQATRRQMYSVLVRMVENAGIKMTKTELG